MSMMNMFQTKSYFTPSNWIYLSKLNYQNLSFFNAVQGKMKWKNIATYNVAILFFTCTPLPHNVTSITDVKLHSYYHVCCIPLMKSCPGVKYKIWMPPRSIQYSSNYINQSSLLMNHTLKSASKDWIFVTSHMKCFRF